ncbi:protein of unknown function DUF1549 [Isosphaera pallida ATCC 43644]|uniref:BIG2 domain-containing protein n=1 Tax=Isosphaera pallida (strain ATCC 43644 / DSM 9630 / IS1B) TaxID=575540 RepID=E8QYA1_ISOPI|nr:DUF1549 domain-containing protein [Isosphaera pallida]ADV63096.1 protein of unknown function DUF1549 [Isosphaera pallida ATCC 43644]
MPNFPRFLTLACPMRFDWARLSFSLRSAWLFLLATLGWSDLTFAESPERSLVIVPATIELYGPESLQRVLVGEWETTSAGSGEGIWVADLTDHAGFEIADPAVASVNQRGVVTPQSEGRTTLTARVGDRVATAVITVRGFQDRRPWSFSNQVQPILTKAGCNMGACHGSEAGKNGFKLTLRGYDPWIDHDVLTRQANGRRIDRAAPSHSLLLLKATGTLDHGGGPRIDPDSRDFRILAEWIAQGAQGPSTEDPLVESIQIQPRRVRLAPGQTQRFLALATYSDGRTLDVTHWTKFAVADESVAAIEEATGVAKVQGQGETAVTAWFASRVARATVSSPYQPAVAPEVYARAPRANRIDDLNLATLQRLNIPPAARASDAAFARRVHLDAVGKLPSPERLAAYLNDSRPDKRERLVDELLASPAYVDRWAYRWSDLLLVSSHKLPRPAVIAFDRFVREAVAHNLPWDEFARRILTARGSTLERGEGNYFVIHRDPIDLTETTAQAFLGLSLTCARCHNHPLEKWTQDQYYGMANLFARVKLKDGTQPGDVIVVAAREGGVPHPRTGIAPAPQPLDGPALDPNHPGDPRAAFVEWLVDPANPAFARSTVNRVWATLFGRGLVHPEDDLRATNPPSDEDLFEYLVADFIAHGYDVRRLIRTILVSETYARSSEPAPGDHSDPRFLARYPARRLAAEVLLDVLSQTLDVPTAFPGQLPGLTALQLPDTKVESRFLTAFGRPERLTTCSCERSDEPSIAQALHLANGSTLNDKLRAQGNAVERWAAIENDDALLERLFLTTVCRSPRPEERAVILPQLAGTTGEARRHLVEDLAWAILTSKEFLFNH